MTKQEAINKVLTIASAETGYLEKRSLSNLYDKTANAGSANFTKYWAEIKPDYQGEPWCACYVTWVFVKAFGQTMAKKLLKHYPYVYCPTMANLFALNSNPKVGDIVIFKRNGVFTHTGIVTGVDGDYFTTNEGNTSGGSTIIANGGAVCNKGYYNSNLPGTKFCTPDWSLVADTTSTENYADEYLNVLINNGVITNKEIWDKYNEPVSKSQAVALIDKVTGGTWNSDESNANIHWVQPNVISLCGKNIITDKSQFLNNPDDPISKALLLALIDKATGGINDKYKSRNADHWGRNHLDSLCDKAIINTPSAWTDFNGQVNKGQTIALVCKAFNVK